MGGDEHTEQKRGQKEENQMEPEQLQMIDDQTKAEAAKSRKKKTRRGQRIKNKLKKFVVWYQNMRGLKSKFESLLDKIDEVSPTIICLTETHLLETEALAIKGYKIFRNDRDNKGGGILVAVREEIKHICTVVEKGKEIGETLWIVINNNQINIRMGVIYAPQESRTPKEDYKIMYSKLEHQLQQAKERQQKLLLMGDFNCKIGDAIKNNRPDITKAGRLRKMTTKHKITIVNSLDICEGLWTRVEGEIVVGNYKLVR